ncbi:VOC family protein [Micromonospora sp. KC606]|uniref:VOC family protein n=1 Tax=Micromonospora sp. KC606 TaxID=2530379 RepID=UPI001A9FECF1|nr:VOC family protein [Micromonospora sp. KC606]
MDFKTRDVSGTADFFSAVLGWRFAVDEDDWRRATVITVGDYRIGTVSDLAAPIYPPDTPPHVAFYLAVDDVNQRAAAAAAHGAQILVTAFDAGDQGRIATLIDPLGAVVSLWQRAPGYGWRHPVGLLNAPHRMTLHCANPNLARRFYRETLGADLRHADFLSVEHTTGTAGQWQLMTTVADLDQLAKRAGRFDHYDKQPPPQLGSETLSVRTREGITIYATTRSTTDGEPAR